eukprot:GHVL01008977.1.p1 GENE.GHVL01008977.1~~GHVL01008977.1.p1  ORF type:complete len:318 (-),score=69.25 GHVL01008977.1:200-1153(-)
MISAKEILDQLMGKDRDLPIAHRKRSSHTFSSDGVCKYYLMDFCPHDLFTNTRSELGKCPKTHLDVDKESFLTLSEEEAQKFKVVWEESYLAFLEKLMASVEMRIKRVSSRLQGAKEIPDKVLSEQARQKKQEINQEISKLLSRAEEFAEKGHLEASQGVMEEMQKKQEEVENLIKNSAGYEALFRQEENLKVCSICGAMQSLAESQQRTEDHISGKQHKGYARIRDKIEELKKKKEERLTKRLEEGTKKRNERKSSDRGWVSEERPNQKRYRRLPHTDSPIRYKSDDSGEEGEIRDNNDNESHRKKTDNGKSDNRS